MTVLAQVILPSLELHHLDLLVPAVSLDGGRHPAVFDERRADGDLIAIADKKHPIEFNLGPFVGLQPLHSKPVTLLDAVLLAARRYHRVHRNAPSLVRHMAAASRGL